MTGKRTPAKSLERLVAKIRARRESLALSQEDVAHAAEMSLRHYQKIESGTVDLRYTSLVAISARLSLDVVELVG